jgi:hypothetical protein
MSDTASWAKRSTTHRYSQDDRAHAWRFRLEIDPTINAFLDNLGQQVLVLGTYNFVKEPWRMAPIVDYRKYGIKIMEKKVDEENVQITLVKKKLTSC